jgi:hypothetical protein
MFDVNVLVHAFRPDAERHEEFCIRRSSIRQAA